MAMRAHDLAALGQVGEGMRSLRAKVRAPAPSQRDRCPARGVTSAASARARAQIRDRGVQLAQQIHRRDGQEAG